MNRITIMRFLYGNTKEIGYMNDYGWKLLKLYFLLFYPIFKIKFKKNYTIH